MRETLAEYPAIAAEWHPTRNGDLTPIMVAARSNKMFWWRCTAKGHVYEARASNRVALGRGCGYCSGRRVGYGNDLVSRFPTVAAHWHPTRNGTLNPDKITPGSHRKVWWLCPRGHDYEMPIHRRTGQKPSGCSVCARRVIGQGNDFATAHPELADQWHPARNGTLRPSDVAPGSGRVVWWLCPEQQHVYDMAVGRRTAGQGCPFCRGYRAGQGNDLAARHPEIARLWHPTRNGQLGPDQVTPASNKLAWWGCPTSDPDHDCALSVQRAVQRWPQVCTHCRPAGSRASNLAAAFPELAAQWHPARNDRGPTAVAPKAHHRVWWRCPQCRYEWRATVASRANGRGCPECGWARTGTAQRSPEPGQSLAEQRPDIAIEFHPTGNGDLTPHTISVGSSQTVMWTCGKPGHEWRATVCVRTRAHQPSGCPFCAGQRATAENNLAVRDPALTRQWNSGRNGGLNPAQVTPNSHQHVWWRCRFGHEWSATVASRSAGRACPQCRIVHSSRIELRIFAELEHLLTTHLPPARHQVIPPVPEGRHRLTIDMTFGEPPGAVIAVEFDGSYWHRTTESHRKDLAKNRRLRQLGYRVLRIREQPLGPLSDDDVVVPANTDSHHAALAVLEKLLALGHLPSASADPIAEYRRTGRAVATDRADELIARAERPQESGGRAPQGD